MSSRKVLINGVTYIRSRDAARAVDLAADYVSRLARQGAIAGKRVSGIDDRAVLSIVVGAINDLAAKIAGFAERFTTKELVATNGSFETVHASTTVSDTIIASQKICLGSRCMTAEQFNHLLDMEAAAGTPGTPISGVPSGSSAPAQNADAISSSTLAVNGNNPAQWERGVPWQDNLGALLTHAGQSETIYSTTTVDVGIAGTTTIDYWAQVPGAQWLHTTRAVAVTGPANDNVAGMKEVATDNSPFTSLSATAPTRSPTPHPRPNSALAPCAPHQNPSAVARPISVTRLYKIRDDAW